MKGWVNRVKVVTAPDPAQFETRLEAAFDKLGATNIHIEFSTATGYSGGMTYAAVIRWRERLSE